MEKKTEHEVRIVLRDWTKVRKANNPVVAERKEKPKKGERNGL